MKIPLFEKYQEKIQEITEHYTDITVVSTWEDITPFGEVEFINALFFAKINEKPVCVYLENKVFFEHNQDNIKKEEFHILTPWIEKRIFKSLGYHFKLENYIIQNSIKNF